MRVNYNWRGEVIIRFKSNLVEEILLLGKEWAFWVISDL